ncbi:MAG: hypothetical protein FWF50_05420 [Defluviitaleaceae bacterium]|nr:hypothetical protein [Defluviitaleaceae bacterium]
MPKKDINFKFAIEKARQLKFKNKKIKLRKKQLNLLPSSYLEQYKAKSTAFKIAFFWFVILAAYIFTNEILENISNEREAKLLYLNYIGQNYIEANELVLKLKERIELINLSRDILIKLGGENDYEQYISKILNYVYPMQLSDISFNTNTRRFNINITGQPNFLPIITERLMKEDNFHNVVIRNSASIAESVRFAIDFYITDKLTEKQIYTLDKNP